MEVKRLLQGFSVTSMVKDHIFPYKVEEYVKYKYVLEDCWKNVSPEQFREYEKELGWHTLITASPTREEQRPQQVTVSIFSAIKEEMDDDLDTARFRLEGGINSQQEKKKVERERMIREADDESVQEHRETAAALASVDTRRDNDAGGYQGVFDLLVEKAEQDEEREEEDIPQPPSQPKRQPPSQPQQQSQPKLQPQQRQPPPSQQSLPKLQPQQQSQTKTQPQQRQPPQPQRQTQQPAQQRPLAPTQPPVRNQVQPFNDVKKTTTTSTTTTTTTTKTTTTTTSTSPKPKVIPLANPPTPAAQHPPKKKDSAPPSRKKAEKESTTSTQRKSKYTLEDYEIGRAHV